MVIISAGNSGEIAVSVSRTDRPQARIAFSASLARLVGLGEFEYIALDHDERARTLTFHPCKKQTFHGGSAYKLVRDGGDRGGKKRVDGRATYVRKTALTFLPDGKLRLVRPPRFGKPFAVSYAP